MSGILPPNSPSDLKRLRSDIEHPQEASPSKIPKMQGLEPALEILKPTDAPTIPPPIASDVVTPIPTPESMKISHLINHSEIPAWRLESIKSQVDHQEPFSEQLKTINSKIILEIWQTSDKSLNDIIQEIPNEKLQTEIWEQLKQDPILYLDQPLPEEALNKLLEQRPDTWCICVKKKPSSLLELQNIPVTCFPFDKQKIKSPIVIHDGEKAIHLKSALIKESIVLKNWLIDTPSHNSHETQISSHCDSATLEWINEVSDNLDQLDIDSIETCFKVFQIADWLNSPALISKVNDFLTDYLPTLNPQITGITTQNLLALSDFQNAANVPAAERAYVDKRNQALNTDFKDLIYWIQHPNLPNIRPVAQRKIQEWLEADPTPFTVVAKCQFLAKQGVYLDSLDVSFVPLTDDNVNAIIDSQPYLKYLDLANTPITGHIHLERLTKLEGLNVFDCAHLTDALAPHLTNCPLTFLNMGGSPELTDAFGECFVNMPLESLTVSGCLGLTNDFGLHLANKAIKRLDLSNNTFTTAFGVHIAQMPHLESLDMQSTDIGDNFITQIEHLPLRTLNVGYIAGTLTDNCALSLSVMRLETLNLSYNVELTDVFLETLTANNSTLTTTLKSLNISGLQRLTSDSGLSIRRLVQLRSLDISENSDMDDLVIAHLIGLPLEYLSLANMELTDGISPSLIQIPTLKTLDISNCHEFTDDIGEAIAQLPHLKSLNVDGCEGMTAEFEQHLIGHPLLFLNGEPFVPPEVDDD